MSKPNKYLLNLDDEAFDKITQPFEDAAKAELKSPPKEEKKSNTENVPSSETATVVKPVSSAEDKKQIDQKEKRPVKIMHTEMKKPENVHPVLSGLRDKPVMLYRKLNEILVLLKATKPNCDIKDVVNELVYEGIKAKGWLKDIQQIQELSKKIE